MYQRALSLKPAEVYPRNRLAESDQRLVALNKEKQYKLLLLDMQMPVMNGYDATARLRQESYAGPIIALTAHAMSGERERCLEAGCDGYVAKPYSPRKLLAEIEQHLA